MRVLSVDDNEENLYLVEAIVRSHGHDVVSAHNGVEALDRLAAQSFDLIVSDVLMPAMDGFQFCRTIKRDERWKQIPFVFYTATYTAKQDEDLGLSLGASRFLVKPVEPDLFLSTLERVVEEAERGDVPVPAADLEDDSKSLQLYNDRLVRKLDRKIQQLEAAQAELAASIENKNREIEQRRLAEEALARSEEQLRLMWEASTDGMLLTSREGVILRANPALARMFAMPVAELPGQMFTCCYREGAGEALARYRAAVESGGVRTWFDTAFLRWDGEQIWTEGSSAIIDLPSGSAVFSIVRDVTQRKRSEQERAALEDQLRQAQKLESIGRLAGGVAHDFNNLLTVINGYSELMLRQLRAGDPLRARAEEIHRAGERASGLTQQLLAFSRKQTLQPRVLDLNTVVEKTRPMLARIVGEDVEILVQLHPEAAVVHADPYQLEQVLMNLAVNSRDAMPRGGRLSIQTSVADVGPGQAHLPADEGPYVVLTVSDTGEGMTEEIRQHIFEPFFTTKEVGKGTGLGLSTVQGVVAQSHGFIEVESEQGCGATFRVYLPRVDGTAAEAEGPAASPELGGRETVLVVEDQPEVARYLTAALQVYGYRVLEAAGAEDALLRCEREQGRVDLLLTDVVMPNASGQELADRVRERWPGIRVLFMSGYTDDTTARYGFRPRAGEFIQKPFGPAQLATKVREVLAAGTRLASGIERSPLPPACGRPPQP